MIFTSTPEYEHRSEEFHHASAGNSRKADALPIFRSSGDKVPLKIPIDILIVWKGILTQCNSDASRNM